MKSRLLVLALGTLMFLTACSSVDDQKASIVGADEPISTPQTALTDLAICPEYHDIGVCEKHNPVISKDSSSIYASGVMENIGKYNSMVSEWWNLDDNIRLKSSDVVFEFEGSGLYYSNIKISETPWKTGKYLLKVLLSNETVLAEKEFTIE